MYTSCFGPISLFENVAIIDIIFTGGRVYVCAVPLVLINGVMPPCCFAIRRVGRDSVITGT